MARTCYGAYVLVEIFENLTTYMIVGIVIVVAVAQFDRLVGSLLAIAFWISVAVVGYFGYHAGGFVQLPGLQLSLTQFLGLCAILAAVQGFGVYQALKRRQNRKAYRDALDDAD